jgi:hypothetical protein
MKKITVFLSVLMFFGCFLYADTAVTITAQVYENMDKISSIEAKYTIETMQMRNSKIEKSRVKNFEIKMSSSTPATTTAQAKTGLYPDCVFNIKNYFSNYDMTVKQKDERIKAGYEELVAVPKSQTNQYPQVRLFVKEKMIDSMNFYDASGKKYYTIKIKKYEKVNGADFPSVIVEKMISVKTTIKNVISYSNFK